MFAWCTASGRSTVNLERPLDTDGDPLAITAADAVVASGVPPWNWRETPGNGSYIIYMVLVFLIFFLLGLWFLSKVSCSTWNFH